MPHKDNCPAWFRYSPQHFPQKHAIIIGAGIAGCQMAWHLSQRGWQVNIIERENHIATQASGNPAGLISPKMTAQESLGERFYCDSFRYAITQLSELSSNHASLEWAPSGLLQLTHNTREQQRWQALKARDFPADFLQYLSAKTASDIAGIPLDYPATYFPQAAWVNPRSVCQALTHNVHIISARDVLRLEHSGNHWQLFDANKQIAHAEVVIITTGKDLTRFEQTQHLAALPVAGQTSCSRGNDITSELKTAIGHEGYLTPVSTHTGMLTFGASFERHVNQPSKRAAVDAANVAQLAQYLPTFAEALGEVQSAHAAVRLTTPDRFPYVGGLPDVAFYQQHYHDLHQGKHWQHYPNAHYHKGLFVLAGLGSRGLTTSGLCAKQLCDLIENQTTPDPNYLLNCHPARFLIKALKRNQSLVAHDTD